MLAHSWVQISISDLLFKCWNSAFLKSFYVVQKMKRSQHLKEITATNMKDVLKHGSFGPVCDPRMAKHFWISWMHARSSWIPLSLLHQGSHGRLQILLDSSHKIWIACIKRALCTPSLACGIWMCYASLRAFPSLFSLHRLYCTLVSLEIEFCFCDEASFGFSACEPSFIFTASNESDGRCKSFSATCVTNNAKFVSFEI